MPSVSASVRWGRDIRRCERSPDDPAGDPAMLRFRDAVDAGAIPFTVQGPENALCLDGGRTIGWEIAAQARAAGTDSTGCSCRSAGERSPRASATAFTSELVRRRSTPCRPRARRRCQRRGSAPAAPSVWPAAEPIELAGRWAEIMQVWDNPTSLADGILDDETYDWIGVFEAMRRSGGSPVVASEADIERAHSLAVDAGFDTSATGSAGLAGLLAIRDQVDDTDRVCVVMSGVAR